MQGKIIIGYTLQRQLGMGGMAEVWYAENAIGKKAAVKLLLPKFCNDEVIVARFQNEAKVMVQLDHPNIRQVYDYGNIDGRPCIVMEYLEGADLKALMKSGKRFTDSELRNIWDQIADALNYTHSQGVVHRDIKPSNIFIDKKGHVKLLDFGIAKIKESISMTQTGTMMGTLIYMSPEQVMDSKHIGLESDIYSLAVTFVHLLSGKAPYDSTTSNDFQIREGIVYKSLNMTGVPAEWQSFLNPYLEKNPAKRPALKRFEVQRQRLETIGNDDEGTIVVGTAKPLRKKKRRMWLWIFVCLLALVGAFAIVVESQKGTTTVSNYGDYIVYTFDGDIVGKSFTMRYYRDISEPFYLSEDLSPDSDSWRKTLGVSPKDDLDVFIDRLNQRASAAFRRPTSQELNHAGVKNSGCIVAMSNY